MDVAGGIGVRVQHNPRPRSKTGSLDAGTAIGSSGIRFVMYGSGCPMLAQNLRTEISIVSVSTIQLPGGDLPGLRRPRGAKPECVQLDLKLLPGELCSRICQSHRHPDFKSFRSSRRRGASSAFESSRGSCCALGRAAGTNSTPRERGRKALPGAFSCSFRLVELVAVHGGLLASRGVRGVERQGSGTSVPEDHAGAGVE